MFSRWRVPGCYALVFIAFMIGCARSVEDGSPNEGRTARSTAEKASSSLVLADLNGRAISPAEDAGTKAVALVFVLPDCPICNAYIPALNRLHEEFSPRGVTLALVHADPETTTEKAKAHASEFQIQCPVAIDAGQRWVKKAGATTAPEAAVFSARGELLYRGRIDDQYAGLGKRRTVVTSHDLRDALEAILAGKPVPQSRTEAVGCPIPK